MTADFDHMAELMHRLMDRFLKIEKLFKDYDLKKKREDLAKAKDMAWRLRRVLVRAVGHTVAIDVSHFERWINQYLAYCEYLQVTAPVVSVPRSIRWKFGRTIGGVPVSFWDEMKVPPMDLIYGAMFPEKKEEADDDRTSEAPSGG